MSHPAPPGRLCCMTTTLMATGQASPARPVVLPLLMLVMLAGAVEAQSAPGRFLDEQRSRGTQYGSFTVEESGSGPPMVFIPGLTSPGWVWDDVVAHYRSRFTCYVLTLAGFGDVPAVENPSLERVRDDLIRFIRERELAGAVLVGHSIGGMLAYWVAATEPALGPVVSVEGATWVPALFDTTATPERAATMAAGMRTGIAALDAEAFAQMSDRMLSGQVGDTVARRRLAPVAARSDPRTTAAFLADQYTTDLREVVGAIRSPVLLLVATGGIAPDARTAYVESARRQLGRVRSVRVVAIEGARHFIQLDAPARLIEVVDRFLEGTGR